MQSKCPARVPAIAKTLDESIVCDQIKYATHLRHYLKQVGGVPDPLLQTEPSDEGTEYYGRRTAAALQHATEYAETQIHEVHAAAAIDQDGKGDGIRAPFIRLKSKGELGSVASSSSGRWSCVGR